MRKLKVQELIIPAKFPNSMPRTKPYLKLQGNWLGKLGFAPGDYVNILPKDGKLIIEKADNQ